MDTNQLLLDQKETGEEIEKTISNYRKEGKRRTLQSAKNRLDLLETLWKKFVLTHDKLEEHLAEDHEYFTQDLFNEAKLIYEQGHSMITAYVDEREAAEQLFLTPVLPSGGTTPVPPEFIQNVQENLKLQTSIAQGHVPQFVFPPTSIPPASTFNQQIPSFTINHASPMHSQIPQSQFIGVSTTPAFITAGQLIQNPQASTIPTFPMHSQMYGAPTAPSFINTGGLCSTSMGNTSMYGYNHPATYNNPNAVANTAMPRPKLPPIRVRDFTGKANEWKPFINTFNQVIGSDPTLHPAEKLSYLLMYIKGEALRVIGHLDPIGDNYAVALYLLRARYESLRDSAMVYVNMLIDLKPLRPKNAQDVIELHDRINEALASLQVLGFRIEFWDIWIHAVCGRKLDEEARRLYEESLPSPTDVPSAQSLIDFLRKRYRVLSTDKNKTSTDQTQKNQPKQSFQKNHSSFNALSQSVVQCASCKGPHMLFKCPKFLEMIPKARHQHAKTLQLCINCLSHKKDKQCSSKKTCAKCSKKHNTLLHFEPLPTTVAPVALHAKHGESEPLFPTIALKVKAADGSWLLVRALLDTGSGDSFITEEVVQQLKLIRQKINAPINGIGGIEAGVSRHKVELYLAPRFPSSVRIHTQALVMNHLAGGLPQKDLPQSILDSFNFQNKFLADPTLLSKGPIDLILGSSIYAEILKEGLQKSRSLLAQNSEFGWLVAGKHSQQTKPTRVVTSLVTMAQIDHDLREFWEMDSIAGPSNVDHPCVRHFHSTHGRDHKGKYIVRLPFKADTSLLGASRNLAMARLINLERKLSKNKELHQEYHSFMKEYVDLGHMTKVTLGQGKYYLPHHAVFKDGSSTTKTRVVFDASARTSSGESLNSILHIGPKLQDDLMSIVIRWRKHAFVINADVEKMFRMIWVNNQDRDFQRILWRDSPNDPVEEYTLDTVTYGTAPASFLSIKVLQQLAKDHGDDLPLAQRAMQDFYVDDVLTGSDSLEEALKLQKELITLLKRGGMNLRKWTANDDRLLSHLPPSQVESKYLALSSTDEPLKALGIGWHPKDDMLQYSITPNNKETMTKRKILSHVASIYDPIGLLAPVILTAKLLIQRLWQEELSWDQQVPTEVQNQWDIFVTQLPSIQNITIPRHTGYHPTAVAQLMGFSDASEKAFGAVIYLRIVLESEIKVTLLAAKTRVAPLKKKITLPRLELCAATLLAELYQVVEKAIQIPQIAKHSWSDSKIVLAWLSKDPACWETYIANRVEKVQQVSHNHWDYVATDQNPADVISRGIMPDDLANHHLWWSGPSWLSLDETQWPSNKTQPCSSDHGEILCDTVSNISISPLFSLVTQSKMDEDNAFLIRFSTWSKTVRVAALCSRFANLTRGSTQRGHIRVDELRSAKVKILLALQHHHYPDELGQVKRNQPVHAKSKLASLCPFIDDDGLLRVNGRLVNSKLPYQARHQVVIPNCHIGRLIVMEAHHSTLHGGLNLTLNQVRTQYWIVNGRKLVSSTLKQCVHCFRMRQQRRPEQLMGQLPTSRVTPSPPFSNCGIDYAGPFTTKCSKGRGIKTTKSYIALFVCFATKAIHLELVSDLSTPAFLATLDRFINRRGLPTNIYSDNGTNFLGASRILEKDLKNAVKAARETASGQMATRGVAWHFIPPSAPHFGGLWEGGVKSTKRHLKAVLGESKLSFEEFYTVLTSVEAALNSRPLTPMSDDVTDLSALTPGHFLIGRELMAPPQEVIEEENPTRRWRLIKKLQQTLWHRWSQEYLHYLQQRHKWKKPTAPVLPGDLVLLVEDNIPPLQWPLARVQNVFPGGDGLPRVADVLTARGIRRRPTTKIVPLPIEQNQDEPEDLQPQQAHVATVRNHGQRGLRPWGQFMWLLLLALLAVASAGTANYNISHPEPGLYFEKEGSASLLRGHLRIETEFSISTMEQDRVRALETTFNTTLACRAARDVAPEIRCDELMLHMNHKVIKILSEIQSLKRQKRGLLGKALTYFFGVNDGVYKEIEHLKTEQHHLTDLHGKHDLFLRAKVNKVIEHVDKRFHNYLEKLNSILNTTKSVIKNQNSLKLKVEVIELYTCATAFLDEMAVLYEKLYLAIYGRAHTYDFFEPEKIKNITNHVIDRIGQAYTVETGVSGRVMVVMRGNVVHLWGQLDITEKDEFEVLQVTPIPKYIEGDKFVIMQPEMNRIAVNFNAQLYFSMEDDKTCKKGHNTRLKCTPHVIHRMNENSICIVDQLFGRRRTEPCATTIIRVPTTTWKQMAMKNVWLYVSNRTTLISITCKGSRNEASIEGVGLIRLADGCRIETGTMIMNSHIDLVEQNHESFLRPIDMHIALTSPMLIADNLSPLKGHEQIAKMAVPVLPTQQGSSLILALTIGVAVLIGMAVFGIIAIAWRSRHKTWGERMRKIISRGQQSPTEPDHDPQLPVTTCDHGASP